MINNQERQISQTNVKYFIYLSILLVLFAFIFVEVAGKLRADDLKVFDHSVIEMIQGNITPHWTAFMKVVTFFGGKVWNVLAIAGSAIILVIFYKKRYALFIVLTCGLGAGFNLLLKDWFERERPNFYRLIVESGYSFPSGHSMGSIILYSALAIVLVKISKKTVLDAFIIACFASLIIAIGISRIYLGVHYPSDVVAGFAAGGFWVCFCTLALNYYEYRMANR
ncbi:phosphatase PAP2 family protein [Bacillus sp. AGMB 02131]|uniref:Phosphatase PAP2 family protein n=1 Tax=Peribacillus faecalis TaxID=2772559 RepID=A0A927D2E2_9BACI|nr:phosphatase PAP2 family protein [Peribacillus faecalis]MBD3109799.1 phosphatase PAP2 family protein [Peribacillus faecalis]